MKKYLISALIVLKIFALNAQASLTDSSKTMSFKWLDIALECTANDVDRDGAQPTVQSRSLGILTTAMYDAWAPYDDKAAGTIYGVTLRRPKAERTQKNKEIAISYAMFNVLMDLQYRDSTYIKEKMKNFGFDINNHSMDPSTPEGIGNLTSKALLAYRHNDGSNQLGNEMGSNGKPYSDYTFYKPVNTWDHIIDPNRWHPLPFIGKDGKTFFVDFLSPHWYRVKPFGLKSASQFRAPDFPKFGSEQLKKDVDELMYMNAHLNHQLKSTVEFMRDGPRSTGQAGHWLRFGELVSIRDKNDIDRDVKMFFTIGVTSMDAFIACWDSKRFYDSARPWTLVREYYKGQMIQGWGGPDKGTVTLPAEEWHPYSPFNFVTPPFPGYVSGHSTVSGACGKVLELFTGSDYFGETENRICGILTETPGDPVSLPLPTFSASAELAGISRVLGGYHIQTDNIEGLKMGRSVATWDWKIIQTYFDGTHKSNVMNKAMTCEPGCTKPCCMPKKEACKPGCTKPCCAGKNTPKSHSSMKSKSKK